MRFGRSQKPGREGKPNAREGIDPKLKARLYSSSLMGCGTPEGVLSNASSLQALMQDHPEEQFLTAEEREQIGEYLRDLGGKSPELAEPFLRLAEFFSRPAEMREEKGPEAPVEVAPPGPMESAPPPPEAPFIANGRVVTLPDTVAPPEEVVPAPPGDLVIESGVLPGQEERYVGSAADVAPPPPPAETMPSLPEPSGDVLPDIPVAPEAKEAAAEEEPSQEAKRRYYSIYTDFADKVESCARDESLAENRKALALGSKLEKLLQEKQVALPMEDAVKLRRAFADLIRSLEEKGEPAGYREALRLAAAFGDEDAAKTLGEDFGSRVAGPPEMSESTAPPGAQPPAALAGKGRPYDAPIDEINALLSQETLGREGLEQALVPAAKLEAMIKEGAAVPLKALKEVAARASELGNGFSAQERWEEAKLAYKLALYFTRDKQAAYEYAAARAEETRMKQLFAGLSKAEAPAPPPPPVQQPPEPEPMVPPRPTVNLGPAPKPKFSDSYLLDPMRAYAVLAGKEKPSPETVLRIIELHKGKDSYTVELAMKHEVAQSPEMKARIEMIMKR